MTYLKTRDTFTKWVLKGLYDEVVKFDMITSKNYEKIQKVAAQNVDGKAEVTWNIKKSLT